VTVLHVWVPIYNSPPHFVKIRLCGRKIIPSPIFFPHPGIATTSFTMSTPPPLVDHTTPPPDVVAVEDRDNNNHGDSVGPNFKDQAREVSFVVAAAAVIGSTDLPIAAAGDDEAQQEGEQQQHLGESLSSLTATAASSPALTSTVIPLAQATPMTVSQIHQEERVRSEQRNAELQAALEERQQAAPEATDNAVGFFAHAAAYWSKLSRKQRRRRWCGCITCVLLIVTLYILWPFSWSTPPDWQSPSILDVVLDSENHTIWLTLIETAAPGDNSLVGFFNDPYIYYQFVFAPTDAALENHQVPVKQLLTAEWRLHRRCFVLGHVVPSLDYVPATAAASKINSNFVEEVNGTSTFVQEWSTLWPEFTVTIRHVYNSDNYIVSSWVNSIPLFMADEVNTSMGTRIQELHERPITPPCVSQSL
jgi:hypothetical protein